MAELKEIFEMVTNKTEPDLDAWQEQERRQRAGQRPAHGGLRRRRGRPGGGDRRGSRAPRHTGERAGRTHRATARGHDGAGCLQRVDRRSDTPCSTTSSQAVQPCRRTARRSRSCEPPTATPRSSSRTSTARTPSRSRACRGQPGCGCGSFDPTWAPDGTKLAFSGTNEAGNRGIYVLDIADRHHPAPDPRDGRVVRDDPVVVSGRHPDRVRRRELGRQPRGQRHDPSGRRSDPADPACVPSRSPRERSTPRGHPNGAGHRLRSERPGRHRALRAHGWDGGSRRRHSSSRRAPPTPPPPGRRTARRSPSAGKPGRGPDGDARARFASSGIGGDPAWSPDGATIYAWQAG